MKGTGLDATFRDRLARVADRLPGQLSVASGRDRASVLMLSNQMLELAARTWAPELRDDPATARPQALDAALAALTEARDVTEQGAAWTGMDPATTRQVAAMDLALLTMGHSLVPDRFKTVAGCWRTVWLAREHLSDALLALRDWERATGVEGVPPGPDGRSQTDTQILALAMRYPAFLRRLGRAA
jgi:hypothetical protein